MTEKSDKNTKYNAKRKPLFRVEIVPSDDEEKLKQMKADIEQKGGNIKKGIIGLWEHGKKTGYFDK